MSDSNKGREEVVREGLRLSKGDLEGRRGRDGRVGMSLTMLQGTHIKNDCTR